MSKKEKENTVKGSASTAFKSDVNIFEKIEVVTSHELLSTCAMIQREHPGKEFSILCKGSLQPNGFVVEDEIAIPSQEVGGADVDFTDTEELEKYRTEGFNTIIHSHPFSTKSTSFSSSDLNTLSVNYDCSILFSGGEFTTSTLRLPFGKDHENILIITAKVGQENMYFPNPVAVSKEKIKSKTYGRGQDVYCAQGRGKDFHKGEGPISFLGVGSTYGKKFLLPTIIRIGDGL